MAAFFVVGFAAHLYAASSFEKIVPGWVPFPRETVFITGIIELAGAIALLIPRTRWWAGVVARGLCDRGVARELQARIRAHRIHVHPR